jgi:hypothetical protein
MLPQPSWWRYNSSRSGGKVGQVFLPVTELTDIAGVRRQDTGSAIGMEPPVFYSAKCPT